MNSLFRLPLIPTVCALCLIALSGCSSMKTPATADVAVSKAAVDNASSAGATELAPQEMAAARDKMLRANQALAAKDYRLAQDLAQQAQADAKLAQSKASSAKATDAANALQEDIRVLREELERANNNVTR
jgi:septal ring factor EnvC (AmiA/AmiB activator)